MINQMVKFGWCTVFDMSNKLVIYTSTQITKIKVDHENSDPDGVPLVWVEGRPVTRVRKMTEEEFTKYVKEFGMKIELDIAVAEKKE